MGNRSLLEFNHDHCPSAAARAEWAQQLVFYLTSGDARDLPTGVTRKHHRHHSEPCPVEALEAIADGDGDAQVIARLTLRRG